MFLLSSPTGTLGSCSQLKWILLGLGCPFSLSLACADTPRGKGNLGPEVPDSSLQLVIRRYQRPGITVDSLFQTLPCLSMEVC